MAFIRLKKISGKQYACLVENTWTPRGPRQQVKQYLGKFIPLESGEIGPSQPDITSVIAAELRAHGFNDQLTLGKVKVNLRLCSVREGKKKVVLGMNGGFFCDNTLRKLLRFQPSVEVTPGYLLARAFSDAGIRVSKEQFVNIYKKVYKSVSTS